MGTSRSYRWVVLAVGTAAQTTVSIVLFSVAVLAPQIRSDFGLTLGQTGVVLAAVGIGMTPALLPWGLLTDRVGERVVLPLGLAVSAVVLARVGYAGTFGELVLLLALAGLFSGSANAASGRAVMQWFDRSERGLALGIRQSSVPFGGLLSAVALPGLAVAAGLGPTYAAIGAACGIAATAGALLLRSPRSQTAPVRVAGSGRAALRRKGLWVVSGGSALLVTAQNATMGFTVLFLDDERGMSTHAAALVFAVSQILGAVLRVAVGIWSDRRGSRIVPLRTLAVVIAAAVTTVAACARGPLWLLLPVIVVAGGIAMSWNGLAFASAAEIAGVGSAGAALGLQQTMLGVAGIVAPIGFAAVVSASSWGAAFLLSALFPLLAWAVMRPLAVRERVAGPGAALSRARAGR